MSVDKRYPFGKYLSGVLVETGAYRGDGIKAALAAGFNRVYSVEIAPFYYEFCKSLFASDGRVTMVLADSGTGLGQAIAEIKEPITFWLDGHHCGGNSGLGIKPAPILEELEQIRQHPLSKQHTILIDDRRHINPGAFGISEDQVINKLKEINPDFRISYEDGHQANDVIVASLPPNPQSKPQTK